MHKPYFISGLITVMIGLAFGLVGYEKLDEIKSCERDVRCVYVDPQTHRALPTSPAKSLWTGVMWWGLVGVVAGLGMAIYGYTRTPLPGEPTMHRLHKFTGRQRKLLGWFLIGAGALEVGLGTLTLLVPDGGPASWSWTMIVVGACSFRSDTGSSNTGRRWPSTGTPRPRLPNRPQATPSGRL